MTVNQPVEEKDRDLFDACVGIAVLAKIIHFDEKSKWWVDLATGEPKDRNVGEMLMLAVSELAEAMEGVRRNLMDDHLPARKMEEVEVADCIIRLLDYCEGRGLDIGGAIYEKMLYNQQRADHKREARLAPNGKKF
jgi:NTP pyrophosphatase (non-canonical NTP hydrolase)